MPQTSITDPEQRESLSKLRKYLAGKPSNPKGHQVPQELACSVSEYDILPGSTIWSLHGDTFYITLEHDQVQLAVSLRRDSAVIKTTSLGGASVVHARTRRRVTYATS